MSISTGATDVVGGYPAAYAGGLGGLGGLGGFGLVGLIGLNSFLGNNNWGNWGGPGFGGPFGNLAAGAGTVVAEQNISDLRKDVSDVDTHVEALGNEIQGALAQQTLGQTQEFRNLDNRLCESEKTTMQGFFAVQTQGLMNTQAIKDQLTAQGQMIAQNFCEVKEAIHADGDATRALINQIETQNLRDALAAERRSRDNREIEINVIQTNQQTQNQFQAQLQQQQQQLTGFLHTLFTEVQLQRQGNRTVQFGTGNVATPTNTANQVGG